MSGSEKIPTVLTETKTISFSGKVPCGSAWELSNVFRCFFYPCDYSTNPVYSGNVTLLGSSLGLTNIAIWDFTSVKKTFLSQET